MTHLRAVVLLLLAAACLTLEGRPRQPVPVDESTKARIEFERDLAPILAACKPCHFRGGKKYADLPFDRPETIVSLGEKLFTRIKDQGDRAVIRAFLSQNEKSEEDEAMNDEPS